MEIIIGRNGNQKTPITDPSVSRKHCTVTVNPDGTFTLENLSKYGTKVNGNEIIRTTVNLNSRLQLGPTFSATLVELIGNPLAETASKATNKAKNSPFPQSSVPQTPTLEPKTFNISHLEHVWDDFNGTNIKMATKQRQVNLVRTGAAVFTMSVAIIASLTTGPVGWILTGTGILGNIYSFVGMKNAT